MLACYQIINTLASPRNSSFHEPQETSTIPLLLSPSEAAVAVEGNPGEVTDDAGAGVVVGGATELVELGV
jgi:hypothetical protein